MRQKKVSLDGAEFTISPLTMQQMDAWLTSTAPEPGRTRDAAKAIRDHIAGFVICPSLNNAQPEKTWDPERCYQELDQILFDHLYSEILAFNGVKFDPQAVKAAAAGETVAAST